MNLRKEIIEGISPRDRARVRYSWQCPRCGSPVAMETDFGVMDTCYREEAEYYRRLVERLAHENNKLREETRYGRYMGFRDLHDKMYPEPMVAPILKKEMPPVQAPEKPKPPLIDPKHAELVKKAVTTSAQPLLGA